MIIVPLSLYPTLNKAKPAARRKWRLVGRGQGVHWPDLDLDLSAEGLVAARPEATSTARRQFSSNTATRYVIQTLAQTSNAFTVSDVAKLLASIEPNALQTLKKAVRRSTLGSQRRTRNAS